MEREIGRGCSARAGDGAARANETVAAAPPEDVPRNRALRRRHDLRFARTRQSTKLVELNPKDLSDGTVPADRSPDATTKPNVHRPY